MTYKLSFRIRKIYYDQIVAGTKTVEVRRNTPFWKTRVGRALGELLNGDPVVCVFICGKEVHRRCLERIWYYDIAAEALGRPPSEQGLKDVGEGLVFGFHLGKVVDEEPFDAPTKSDAEPEDEARDHGGDGE